MRRDGSNLGFSATDLAHFSACGQRTLLDRLRTLGKASPERLIPDPRLDLLRERGYAHEGAYLEQRRAEGKRVVAFGEIPPQERHPAGYTHRAAETEAAMRGGADVIHQGMLYDGVWLGAVDFLVRVERPSDLGDWSYEVIDAKLAREARAAAVLQTCVYSELLARVQGSAPERVHLYLGGPAPRLASYRLAHFAAYTRALKGRFLTHVASATDAPPVAPDPVEHCDVCDWRGRCGRERVEVDHLSLVAGITRDQRRALEARGVTTLAGLAIHPLEEAPDGLRAGPYTRIREQARVQWEGRTGGAPVHELLPLEVDGGGPALGLAALPEPSSHDLFFDIEGADYAYEEGLEYLFGISWMDGRYEARWALTPGEEKAALDAFLGMASEHVARHPSAHIYHFGHYETSTLKRLVGRYGIRTEELDRLLQQQVFVDLHRVVKQGVRASVASYSIKALEAHYGFERGMPLSEATPARIRLELAFASGLRDDDALADRPTVKAYNRDDCDSTRALRGWLEGMRGELERREGREIPRPAPPEPKDESDEQAEVREEVRALFAALLESVPDEPDARSEEEQARWLMAHLLEWHRREDKSPWWEYFRMRDLSDDELVEEMKPIGGLEYVGEAGTKDRSNLHRFRFPLQKHRFEEGDSGVDPRDPDESQRTIHAIDDVEGWLDLKVGKDRPFDPHALGALIAKDIIGAPNQQTRLRTTGRKLLEGEAALETWSPASLALLRRRPPSFEGGLPLTAVAPDAPLVERCRQAVQGMRDGVLPVQGPPGTGKTYSGARMIRALLRGGRRVGVTGPSHKVITNLLDAVCRAEENDEPTRIVGVQAIRKGEDGCAYACVTKAQGTGGVAKERRRRDKEGEPPFNLIAGTAWLWSTDARERSVDVLFIDEAGQFSLANALAVAPAAPKLVLLGDPQQLNQPQKGVHPPGAELSVLEHLAGEDGILGGEQGLFLGETWRMRPEITAFTSELFYEGKLRPRADLAVQGVTLADGQRFHGLHFLERQHQGNSRESEEEAAALVALFREMLTPGSTFTDRAGRTRPLRLKDLLVVAPYNAQVSLIRKRLSEAGFEGAHIGTVDKFQGQEAPVAVYSLTSSSAEDAPRGMEFLYALDRLNVATSRARVATVVVGSPRLFAAVAKRPEQMRLVNAFLRFGEMAG